MAKKVAGIPSAPKAKWGWRYYRAFVSCWAEVTSRSWSKITAIESGGGREHVAAAGRVDQLWSKAPFAAISQGIVRRRPPQHERTRVVSAASYRSSSSVIIMTGMPWARPGTTIAVAKVQVIPPKSRDQELYERRQRRQWADA